MAQNAFQETPCNVVVRNNFDTCGTITRSSIASLTPEQLLTLFKPDGKFGDMTSWFRTSFEMKACGTKTNGIYDWLMSSNKAMGHLVSSQKLDRGISLLFPFIMAKQDSVINKDFWAITGGAANSAYTPDLPATIPGTFTAGPLTTADKALGAAGDRVIRVVTRYGIDLDAKWFIGRDRVEIGGLKNGQAMHGVWKVLASEVSTDLSYIDVLITSENAGSVTPYDTAPTSGVLLALGNNVNDFESWCNNRPTIDPRHRVPFWYQTMRRTRCVDSEYKLIFEKLIESNEYFRNFGDLDIAERNRQDEEEYQHRWVNSFFFGKAISANQTLANWQSLEQILTVTGATVDAGNGGKLVAYRANMIGVREQLQACGRVKDLGNNPLNMYEFLDEIYRIVRARKSQGKTADSIDVYTDSEYAALFETGFVNYLKNEYGDILRINLDVHSNTLGFTWKSYQPKFPSGVTINIITHPYFDDLANAYNTESVASAGTLLLILEMGTPGAKGGTIYPGTIASERINRANVGDLEQLSKIDSTWACTMKTVTRDITLVSDTITAVVECPSNSLWLSNLARAVPTTTAKTGPVYSNLYGWLGWLIPIFATALGALAA